MGLTQAFYDGLQTMSREQLIQAYEAMMSERVIRHDVIAAMVRDIHVSPFRAMVVSTGGGTAIQDLLWRQPGASGTLLEASLTYARESSLDFIGHKPEDGFCSRQAALCMASAAYDRAFGLAYRGGEHHPDIMGVGITAALATNRELRGGERAHICIRKERATYLVDVGFTAGRQNREQQGQILDAIAVAAMEALVPTEEDPTCARFDQLMFVEMAIRAEHQQPLGVRVWAERVETYADQAAKCAWAFDELPLFLPNGKRAAAETLDPKRDVLFSGSWDPVTPGHLFTAKLMEQMFPGMRVVCEITDFHPRKGDIRAEIPGRIEQFRWRRPVLVTHGLSLFIQKAEAFPGFGMLLGADVVRGILDKRYYEDSLDRRDAVLRRFRELGTKFYVNGRLNEQTGVFETIENLPIPAEFKDLFIHVSGRWDISSTSVRNAKK